MLKLYELGDELETIYAELSENGGELTDEMAERLDALEGDFATKAERTALMVKQLQAQAEVVTSEAKRLADRAGSLTKGADSLKSYLHAQMVRVEKAEVKGSLVTVRLQNSPPSAKCGLPADILPTLAKEPGYSRFIVEVPATVRFDGKAAIAAHKAGEPLPEGIVVTQSTHIRFY